METSAASRCAGTSPHALHHGAHSRQWPASALHRRLPFWQFPEKPFHHHPEPYAGKGRDALLFESRDRRRLRMPATERHWLLAFSQAAIRRSAGEWQRHDFAASLRFPARRIDVSPWASGRWSPNVRASRLYGVQYPGDRCIPLCHSGTASGAPLRSHTLGATPRVARSRCAAVCQCLRLRSKPSGSIRAARRTGA